MFAAMTAMHTMHRRAAILFAACMIALAAITPCRAAEDPLTSGLTALRGGNFKAARELLQNAYQQNPRASILCHFGKLAVQQGLAIQGQDFYRRCLSDATDSGEPLPPELEAEARAATATEPSSAGEIIAISSRAGFLWIDDMLSASLRAGSGVQIALPEGRHELRLSASKLPPIILNLQVRAQTVTEVDFDRQQFSSPAPILLLPFDARGALSLEGSEVGALVAPLAAPLHKENGLLVGLSRLRALARTQPAALRCGEKLSCLVGIGQRLDATFVLGLHIDPPLAGAGSNDYQLRAWLIEAHVGKETSRSEAQCRGCQRPALEQALVDLVLRVFDEGRRPARQIEVASSPAAELVIDGESRGQTPRRLWLLPGEHEVALSRRYFVTRREQIRVDEDAAEKAPHFAYTLDPAPLSSSERATRYAAWITGGVGLGALAVGLGLSLRPNDVMAPADDMPGALLSTQPPGLVLTIAGGALLGTGIVLFAVDRYRQAQRAKR